jgi:hypothetical protein
MDLFSINISALNLEENAMADAVNAELNASLLYPLYFILMKIEK